MLMNGSRVSIQRTTSSVIEVSCARPWIRSWPTMRFYNVVVTKIYGTRRKGCNKIQPLGIVMAGETLLLSLRFLSICSTSYFRFGEAVNHPIFTISNYILKRDKNQSWTLSLSLCFRCIDHLPSNKFHRLFSNARSFSLYWRYPARINGSGDIVFLSIILRLRVMQWIESYGKKNDRITQPSLIGLVIIREENSPRDKIHYGRFRPRNVERCVTRRCVIRRLSCALSNQFRLERSAKTLNRGCDGGIIRDTVSIPNSQLCIWHWNRAEVAMESTVTINKPGTR